MNNNIISLNGDWKVVFDDDNKGRYLELQNRENFLKQEDIHTVEVPSCLEEYKEDYQGVAWYYKNIHISEDYLGKNLRISFDAVNYRCEVWLNGYPVGIHEGGYVGFEFDITSFVKHGEDNDLSVRVITPLITRDVVIDGLARDEAPHWRGAIAGGIWQNVSIKSSGSTYLEEIFVQPDIKNGKIDVSMNIINNSMETIGHKLNVFVDSFNREGLKESVFFNIEAEPGINKFSFEYDMGSYDLWSFDNPNLYLLSMNLMNDNSSSDNQTVRFGMREFTIDGADFILNGEKVILKGAFYEGVYPHSLAYPRDIEVLRKTLTRAKEAGLNLIRPWRKPQPPIVYDMADELGIFFIGTLPIECMDYWPKMTPGIYKRIDNEISEMIIRDRNHPSIIMWEMFNEIWRLPLKQYKHKASLIARYNDPARIILDEAGGFAGGASIYLPYSKSPVVMNDVHHYPRAPFEDKEFDNFLALAKTPQEIKSMGMDSEEFKFRQMKPGVLTNISEIGYGSVTNLEENMERYQREGNKLTPDYKIHERLYSSYKQVLDETGIIFMFGSLKNFSIASQKVHANGNKFMIESCRLNENIGGIMVHALADGDWVVGAGMLDQFGDTKESYYGVKKGFSKIYISTRVDKVNLIIGEPIKIDLRTINDTAEVCGNLKLYIVDENCNEFVISDISNITIKEGINFLNTSTTTTSDLYGMCKLKVEFKVDDEVFADNEMDIYILEPFNVTKKTLCFVEKNSSLKSYADSEGIPNRAFDDKMPIDVPLFYSGSTDEKILTKISEWVDRGGCANIMTFPQGVRMPETIISEQLIQNYLPFDVITIQNQDLWSPSNHILRDHSLFRGLPTEIIMDNPFKNILPRQSIVNYNDNWFAGTIYYTWFGGQEHKQHYYGVNKAEHASDVVEIPYGKGKFILNTIRIADNINSDRIAQLMFNNLAEWK
ncbi:MAG: hypothetical protein OCD02_22835 [Spirochaetaceae bacterium]